MSLERFVLTWITEVEFNSAIDNVVFDQNIQRICGTILSPCTEMFSFVHAEISGSEYLFEAWRWCGIVDGIFFYLDVAANDRRRVKPLSFNLYSQFGDGRPWKKLIELAPVIDILGKSRINHVASTLHSTKYALLRDNDPLSTAATIVYRCESEVEVHELSKYLATQYLDEDLYIARRI